MHSANRGASLIELLLALTIVALTSALALDSVVRVLDRWAVEGSRTVALAILEQARARARASGGAEVRIEEEGARLVLRSGTPAQTVGEWSLARLHGVTLDLGARSARVLRFDPAGLGRVANQTLRIQRGRAEARVVISLYGRAR
jgi:type II secretory pathway pseudopilin PulG